MFGGDDADLLPSDYLSDNDPTPEPLMCCGYRCGLAQYGSAVDPQRSTSSGRATTNAEAPD
jgi:hypothetical protein